MPITARNKKQVLLSNGFNPDEYDVDEQGNISKLPVAQVEQGFTPLGPIPSLNKSTAPTSFPALEQSQPALSQPVKEQTSATGAFGASAAANVLPTAAGVGVGSAVATIASGLLAPETGGLSLLIPPALGLLGGMGGAYGASKAQEKVIEATKPDWNRYLGQAQSEHPYSSLAGSFAGAGPFFRPSLRNVQQAGSTLSKIAKGANTAGELPNLANVAIGTGMGAVPTVEKLVQGQPVDPIEAGLGLAGGAIFNKPAGFLSRLGIHDTPVEGPTVGETKAGFRTAAKSNNLNKGKLDVSEISPQVKPTTIDPISGEPLSSGLSIESPRSELLAKGAPTEGDLVARQARVMEMQAENQKLVKESEIAKAEREALAQRDAILKQRELEAEAAKNLEEQRVKDAQEREAELAAKTKTLPETIPVAEEIKSPVPVTSEELIARKNVATPEVKLVRPIPTPEQLSTAIGSKTGVEPELPAAERLKAAIEGNRLKEPREGYARYQGVEEPVSKDYYLPERIAETLRKNKVPTTRGMGAAMVNWLKNFGKLRNVSVTNEGRIVDEKGVEQRGTALVRSLFGEASAKLSSDKATLDTGFHEIFHNFLDDMLNNPKSTSADKALAKKALDAIGNSAEFKEKFGPNADPEEVLTSNVGKEAVGLMFERGPKGLMKDLISHMKVKYSDNATAQDYARFLGNRLAFDAPYKSVYGAESGAPLAGIKSAKEAFTAAPEPTAPSGLSLAKGQPREEVLPAQTKVEEKTKPSPFDTMHQVVDEAKPEVDSSREIPNKAFKDVKAGAKYQDAEVETTDNKAPVQVKWLSSQFDKVRAVNQEVGDALHSFASEFSFLQGHGNKAKDLLSGLSKDEVASAISNMRTAFRNGDESWTPTTRAEEVLSELFTTYRKLQNESGLTIDGRKGSLNKSYVPDMMSDRAIQILREKPASSEASKLKSDWVEYLTKDGMDSLEAKNLVDDYVAGMSGNAILGIEFGALRKAEGRGMPESIRETDPVRIIDKYTRRASKDLAFWNNLQKPDRIAAALGIPRQGEKVRVEGVTDIRSMPEVEGALKAVSNDFSYAPSSVQGAVRLLSNSIMQLGTGIRNTAQVPANIAPYIQRFSDLNALIAPMFDWKKNAVESLHTNARQNNLDDRQIGRIINPNPVIAGMDKIAQAMRKYSGRELLEQSNRIYTYGVGDYLVRDNYQRMLSGDTKGKKFIERFSENMRNKEEVLAGNASNEDFLRMAKEFVDTTEGSYDARGLPIQALEGPTAPYLALSRWSLEKFNTIQKDVITPMVRDGNFLPFLLYTGASWLTGTAIKQLNEVLSNKKSQDASFTEASAAGELDDQAAAIIATMQLGSYAGIASDFVKAGSDLAIKGKTPRGINFPLADFMANGVAQGIADYNAAVNSGVPRVEAATGLMQELAKNYVQNYRYAYNNFNKEGAEQAERSDKFRDLQVWEELTGKPPTVPEHQNKLIGADERKFKQTGDMAEAATELGKILQDTISKNSDDPYKMTSELKKKVESLRRNSYQTIPSPENMPMSFVKYLEYLTKTQGEEAANERLVDYLLHKNINSAKSQMVPKI